MRNRDPVAASSFVENPSAGAARSGSSAGCLSWHCDGSDHRLSRIGEFGPGLRYWRRPICCALFGKCCCQPQQVPKVLDRQWRTLKVFIGKLTLPRHAVSLGRTRLRGSRRCEELSRHCPKDALISLTITERHNDKSASRSKTDAMRRRCNPPDGVARLHFRGLRSGRNE